LSVYKSVLVFTYFVLIKRVGEWVAERVESLKIVDYCLCLRGCYVVVEGPRGRALGFLTSLGRISTTWAGMLKSRVWRRLWRCCWI
jgi:hypothetical protein